MLRAKKEVNGNEVNPVSDPKAKKVITFTNKINKEKSLIIDAFRVIGWQEFKSKYKVKGLEGYQEFFEAWSVHEIHQMSLNELQVMYSGLGYNLSDLVKIRNDYYSARRNNDVSQESALQESNDVFDELAF